MSSPLAFKERPIFFEDSQLSVTSILLVLTFFCPVHLDGFFLIDLVRSDFSLTVDFEVEGFIGDMCSGFVSAIATVLNSLDFSLIFGGASVGSLGTSDSKRGGESVKLLS